LSICGCAIIDPEAQWIGWLFIVPPMTTESPLVVCPLEHERRCLVRAGLRDRCELHVCGPGSAAVARWGETVPMDSRLVILAGLAGALRQDIAPGAAEVIGSVRRPSQPDLLPVVREGGLWTVASASEALRDRDAKQRFAAATGADLVDMESQAFAELAAQRRWRWAIVRGVSDSLEMALPRDINSWVDARGRSRPLRIVISIMRRPRDGATVLQLARHSASAMDQVARCINRLLDRLRDAPGPPPDQADGH
jgi:hypothetical protein